MSEYLTKEEIKQWRSSLEKITLEEYAARLGKQIEEAKKTNDLVDIILRGKSYTSTTEASQVSVNKAEKVASIAEQAISKERKLVSANNKTNSLDSKKTETKEIKNEVKEIQSKPIIEDIEETDLKEEVQIVFKKALTDREQMVFNYFLKNKNKIVYAKDLANLLSLPRDYVYKYIKNLRAKIDGDKLKNADSGGFLLSV